MKKLLLVGFAVCLIASTGFAKTESYSWEDGTGTIMGSYGNLVDDTNVSGPQSGQNGLPGTTLDCPGPADGTYYLHVAEETHSGTPYAMVACITGLQEGDSVFVTLYCYDNSLGVSPSGRLWGGWHDAYACLDCPGSYVSSAGAGSYNSDYSPGNGWDQMEAHWAWYPPEGTGSLVVQARLYSAPSTCDSCRTDYWFDLVEVTIPDYGSVRFPDFGPTAVENSAWGSIKALYR